MIPGIVSAFYLFGNGYTYGVSLRGYGQKFTIPTCWWFLGDDFRIVSVFSAQLGSIMDTCTASVYEASFFVFCWSLVSSFSAQCLVRHWNFNAPRAVFSSLVGRSRMLVILADMDQKNSCCGMFKTGFTGCAAPRAVSVSLVRRPVMLGMMACMDQDDSYCGMYKTGYAGCVHFAMCLFPWLAGLECSAFWPVWTRRTVARGVQALVFLGDDFYEFLYSALSLVR